MSPGSIFVALGDVSLLIRKWYNFHCRKSTMKCDGALGMVIGTGPPSSLRTVAKFGWEYLKNKKFV